MGTLTVETLRDVAGTVSIPARELKQRVIQYYQALYTGGEWNPDNTYTWVPGAFYDFTPRRADSRIKYTMRLPMAWVAATHAIGNFYFYANNILYYSWSEGLTYYENGRTYEFEVPSWGTGVGRIGLQHRAHANDNNEIRMYTTYHWDGTGRSAQNSRGHLMIEELLY